MTFRDAMLDAMKGENLSGADYGLECFYGEGTHFTSLEARDVAVKIQAARGNEHKVFWKFAERIVRRRYRKATGKDLPQSFDFGKIIGWIKDNLPAILQLLAALLPLLLMLGKNEEE